MSDQSDKKVIKPGKGLIFACCAEELKEYVKEAAEKGGKWGLEWVPAYSLAMTKLGVRTVSLAILEYFDGDPAGFERVAAFLKQTGVSFIVICRHASQGFEGMRLGAANMLVIRENPQTGTKTHDPYKFFMLSLSAMIRNVEANGKEARTLKSDFLAPVSKIIAIGASTGGSEAVVKILKNMPADAPPIVVAMHMPPVFTKIYAERLNMLYAVTAWEAEDGDRLRPGLALVAKGDMHLTLKKDNNGYYVSINDEPPVRGFRPSVDKFFESVAKHAGSAAVGVILTGMGSDGANGMVSLVKAGAYTIGQDEATSVVYGMPRAAYEMGGVAIQAPIQDIAAIIMNAVNTH